jgi:predicted nucleotidyltransferase component of viral defense system
VGDCLKLHDDKEAFGEAIRAAAAHFKIREVFIEKDYWVTFVLKSLSHSKYAKEIVFKGGTSLSKAYGKIERFSEDIDLAIVSSLVSTETDSKALFAKIERGIALSPLSEKTELSFNSKSGKFRRSHWMYPRVTEGEFDPAKDKIMLEITSSAVTEPIEQLKARSLVAEFLSNEGKAELIEEYDLSEFEILVLSHKRTFAEKIVAIANACHKDETLALLGDKIRHLYDLTLLFRDVKIQDFVKTSDFRKMVKAALDGDRKFTKDPLPSDWKSAAIFVSPKSSLKLLKKTYELQLGPLVFDKKKMPTMKEIEKMLISMVSKKPAPGKKKVIKKRKTPSKAKPSKKGSRKAK